MKVERVKVQNKKIIDQIQMDIDVYETRVTGLINLHENTREALAHSFSKQ